MASSTPSSTSSQTPPSGPIMTWSREEIITHADHIRQLMSTWEECTHTMHDLKVTTTPAPNATIVIVNVNTGEIIKKIP